MTSRASGPAPPHALAVKRVAPPRPPYGSGPAVHQVHVGLKLTCTHFTTVSGIVDRGNYSCTRDLAILAHAVLEQPLLARIVATPMAAMPLPVKGGKVWLYNNNPLLIERYRGANGVKTGY